MIKPSANIHNIKVLISNNQIDKAINKLKNAIDKHNDKELINEFALLSSQYAHFKRKDRLQLQNEITHKNRIVLSFLELIDLLKESINNREISNAEKAVQRPNFHSKKETKGFKIKQVYENNMDYIERFYSLNTEISEIIFSQKKNSEDYSNNLLELENHLQQLSVLRHKIGRIQDEILVPYWMDGNFKRSAKRLVDWFEGGISFVDMKTLIEQVDEIIIKGEKSKVKYEKTKLIKTILWGVLVLLLVSLFLYVSFSFF